MNKEVETIIISGTPGFQRNYAARIDFTQYLEIKEKFPAKVSVVNDFSRGTSDKVYSGLDWGYDHLGQCHDKWAWVSITRDVNWEKFEVNNLNQVYEFYFLRDEDAFLFVLSVGA